MVNSGKRIKFWSDPWCIGGPLQFRFPRIFALSINRGGYIQEYGDLEGGSWAWKVELRRGIFDWEKEQWEEFWECIKGKGVKNEDDDCIVWNATSDNQYLAKSFCNLLFQFQFDECRFSKFQWIGHAPPKVEVFLWQLLLKRIATKDELFKRNIISNASANCVFCGDVSETNSHLFFTCHFSWRIWQRVCSLWGLFWVCHMDPLVCFLAWQEVAAVKVNGLLIWRMFFFAVVWSLWLHRKDFIFNGKVVDELQLFDLIKMRVAWWARAKWPDTLVSVEDVFREPTCFVVPDSHKKKKLRWIPPSYGAVKFNVDASFIHGSSEAGIGGLLRDSDGKSLIIFAKKVEAFGPITAELLAIK